MKHSLLILGAGQYGWVAKETAEAMGCFEKIAFLDDASEAAMDKLDSYDRFTASFSHAFVAMGNPALRLQYIQKLQQCGFAAAVLVHPHATVMPSAVLGPGSIVEARCVINSNTAVGTGCILSAGAVVNHNSTLGDGCHVDCNATVPAGSILPPHTKVPCGTVFAIKE